MKLRTLKQLLNACPNDDCDIEVILKTKKYDDEVELESLDYGTDTNGNIVSLKFNVKLS